MRRAFGVENCRSCCARGGIGLFVLGCLALLLIMWCSAVARQHAPVGAVWWGGIMFGRRSCWRDGILE